MIHHFDVFAEYTRQQTIEEGMPLNAAQGYGLGLAKVLAAAALGTYGGRSRPSRDPQARAFDLGGHAAIGWGAAQHPGYHFWNVASQSPFTTLVRLCRHRCAPRGVQALCGCLQPRLLSP
jgi:hypothetical protein